MNHDRRYFLGTAATAIAATQFRWRLGLAAGEPQYDDLEKRLA